MHRPFLAGNAALVAAGLAFGTLGAPARAQLSETQIRYEPVVLATTCELTPRDGSLNYDQSTRRTISSEGSPGYVKATLSGVVGTGTPSGPVLTFENPTLIGGTAAVNEVRVGQGNYSQRQMVAFERGSTSLEIETDVRFQSVAAFPDGTYSATVDVMCFQAGF